jgi:phage/plasmid-associated DNA primase
MNNNRTLVMDADFDTEHSITVHTRKAAGDLDSFFKNHNFETPKKCPYTNIIDQRQGKTYCIPFPLSVNTHDPNKFRSGRKVNPQAVTYFGSYADQSNFNRPGGTFIDPVIGHISSIEELFMRLEACRLDGIVLSFSERQYFTINRTISTEVKRQDVHIIKPPEPEPEPNLADDSDSNPTSEAAAEPGSDSNPTPKKRGRKPKTAEPERDEYYFPDTEQDIVPDDPVAIAVQDKTFDLEVVKSCIEYDFDIYLQEHREMRNNLFSGVLSVFTNVAIDVIDWEDPVVLENPLDPKSGVMVTFYAAILRKPQRRINDPADPSFRKYGECWKESFHIRIFIKVTKEVKLFMRKKMIEDSAFQSLFQGIGMINELDNAFDKAVCSNPIMFLGSAKKGGNRPHELETLYHVECRTAQSAPVILTHDDFKSMMKAPQPYYDSAGRKRGMLPAQEFCKYNLCYELSLNYEVPDGLIRKHEYDAKKKYRAEVTTYGERLEGDISEADLADLEHDVQSIVHQNNSAAYDKAILDIIGRKRAIEYADWKTVILALCRKNPHEYKKLAHWFSLRYAQSFLKDGAAQIDGLWRWAEANRMSDSKNTSMATIYYWARQDDPVGYRELQDNNIFMKLLNILTHQQGEINNTQVAMLLHEMFGHKFRCDVNPNALGKDAYVWREFVTEKDDREDGELYKWRKQGRLVTLEDYVSKTFPKLVDKVIHFYKTKIDSLGAELVDPNVAATRIEEKKNEKKYYEEIKKRTHKFTIKLGNSSVINPIIERCKLEFQFGNRGFEKKMDKELVKDYIGTQNGVLDLRRMELIQWYHELPISKSVSVDYIPYNPADQYTVDLMQVFLEIFDGDVESMEFVLYLLASGLDDNPKTPQFFFIMHGDGSQGKSVINLLDMNTLGLVAPGGDGGYSVKMDVGWYCSDRKSSGPDAAISATKKARRIWCSESDIEAVPRTGKIKEITSDPISANDKNEKQDTWKVNAHILVPTNHKMRILGRDYGIWRRILYYRFKRQFKRNDGPIADRYDPNNPKHSLARQEIIDEWVYDNNYKRAYFSILTHFYRMLRQKYGGDIRKVPKRQIDSETEDYHAEQDSLTQFIRDRVMYIGDKYPDGTEVELIDISTIMKKYITWFTTLVGNTTKFNQQELKEEIKSHYKLKKHFDKMAALGEYLPDHKILDIGENKAKFLKTTMQETTFNKTDELSNQIDPKTPKLETQEIQDNIPEPELPSTELTFDDFDLDVSLPAIPLDPVEINFDDLDLI